MEYLLQVVRPLSEYSLTNRNVKGISRKVKTECHSVVLTSTCPSRHNLPQKSSNLVYQLQCTKYIEEMCEMLMKFMNGDRSTCLIPNSYVLVPIPPASISWMLVYCIIHKLLDATPIHVHHQFETTYVPTCPPVQTVSQLITSIKTQPTSPTLPFPTSDT